MSSRERALLELLREVRTALQLQAARELFFATLGLRTTVVGELLTGCTSVKTVRLFLMWASEAENVDVETLRASFNLPTGSASRWIGTLADGSKLVLPAHPGLDGRATRSVSASEVGYPSRSPDPVARVPHPTLRPEETFRRIVSPVERAMEVDLGALARVCDQYGIAELAIFGSALTGTMTADSDIDVLYVLRDGVRLGWAVNDLSDELSEVLGRRVDLVAKQALHPRLRSPVLAEAQVIYAA